VVFFVFPSLKLSGELLGLLKSVDKEEEGAMGVAILVEMTQGVII